MTKVKACNHCRLKRVKCNGKFPICGSCSTASPIAECVYGPSHREKIIKLYKKEACFPCRRKKKRCDAVRPICGKCRLSRTKGDVCTYEVTSPDCVTVESPRSRRVNRTTESSDIADKTVAIRSPASDLTEPEFQINPALSFPDLLPNPLTATIVKGPDLLLGGVEDPFKFALSDVSMDDLNMKFRVIFVSQRFLYGIYFPPPKLQVLLSGDTSSPILHAFFIHFANLAGAQFYQERCRSYSFLAIQARHLFLARQAIKRMTEKEDPLAFAQANFYMGSACCYARSMPSGKRYLKVTVEILRRNNIRFVPVSEGDSAQHELNTVPSLEPLELVRERVTLLTQVVFVEVMFYLLGQPSLVVGFNVGQDYKSELPMFYSDVFLGQDDRPLKMSLELEYQFRYELPVAYPNMVFPSLSRVQSTIFAKDGSNIVAWFQQQVTPSDSWISTCHIFIWHLASHISELKTLEAESEDAESRLVFHFCRILDFTTYAQIVFVLAMSSSSSADSCEKFLDQCNDALSRVLVLVEEIELHEFLTLDTLLGVAWSRAILLFESGPYTLPSPSSPSARSSMSPSTTTSSVLHSTTPESSPLSSDNHPDLTTNIAKIIELNGVFIRDRYIEGTANLCANLASMLST